MSEYQFFDFQTIDRPLTEEEQAEIHKLSSRVLLTSTQAIFTYQFGDFHDRPEKVLEQYFDAMLYLANWGSRRLMFRFPKSLITLSQVQPYEVEDVVEFREEGAYTILDINFLEAGGVFWVEGEGRLSSLIQLRDDILRHDYRVLYLAWLKAISLNLLDKSEPEPPVPPGFRTLSSALQNFIDLFEIDKHLVAIATKVSGIQNQVSKSDLRKAIAQLSREECEEYLFRLTQGEPHLSIALTSHLFQVRSSPQFSLSKHRTVKQLLKEAERAREEEKWQRALEAEQKRIQALEALARREGEAWQEVERLIQKPSAKTYDEAVHLLSQLREVASRHKQEDLFQQRHVFAV